MVCILDLGGEGFNRRLEASIDVGRDMFIGGNNGMAGVTRFMYLRK